MARTPSALFEVFLIGAAAVLGQLLWELLRALTL